MKLITIFAAIFISVLAIVAVFGQPSTVPPAGVGIWVGVGPSGQLPAGNYRFVFIPTSHTEPVKEQSFVLGGDPGPPPPPPPPPPTELREQVSKALTAITDPNKKTVGNSLASAFEQLIESVDKGEIANREGLSVATSLFLVTVLRPQAAWQSFNDVVKPALDASVTLASYRAAVKLITEELRKIP